MLLLYLIVNSPSNDCLNLFHEDLSTMNWSEDSWEDVSEPPSPELQKALQFFAEDPPRPGHPEPRTLTQPTHKTHSSTETQDDSLDSSESPKSEATIEEWTSSDISELKQLLQDALEYHPARLKEREPEPHHTHRQLGTNSSEFQNPIASSPSGATQFETLTKHHNKSTSRFKRANSETKGRKSNKLAKSHQHSKLKNEILNNNNNNNNNNNHSPKVPYSFNSNPSSANSQQKEVEQKRTDFENSPSSQNSGVRITTETYPKAGLQNGSFSRNYKLHEYMKEKYSSRYGFKSKYTNYYESPYTVEEKDADVSDEDEEKVNAIICFVFFLLGLGFMIGFVFVLVNFAQKNEQEQMGIAHLPENNYAQVKTEVYHRRVVEIIRSAQEDTDRIMNVRSKSQRRLPQTVHMELCSSYPLYLVGNTTAVNPNITISISDILKNNSDVTEGGEWKPSTCISRHRVAVVIPYRDRWPHLKVLLYYLIPTLKRQEIHFRIFVVEQYGNETFNKGRIMNAAFREALKLFDFHCVTFHDVDLIPEDDRNIYSCMDQPKHMSFSIDKFQYILPYDGLVGGVLMFKTEHFELVNGYSNMYWGWGAEDDDMTTRILHHGLRIYRPPSNIAKYKMVKHDGRKGSEVAVRMKLLRSAARRSKLEGLNNVQYKVMDTHLERLFTHFVVDIGHP